MTQHAPRIIPIYSSKGEVEGFLAYPYLFNRNGEWIGWVTPQRDVYSVMGYYVGYFSDDARILRKRSEDYTVKPHLKPPPSPGRINIPATLPLAPMLKELTYSLVDVFVEEPERLHTLDGGDLRQDMD